MFVLCHMSLSKLIKPRDSTVNSWNEIHGIEQIKISSKVIYLSSGHFGFNSPFSRANVITFYHENSLIEFIFNSQKIHFLQQLWNSENIIKDGGHGFSMDFYVICLLWKISCLTRALHRFKILNVNKMNVLPLSEINLILLNDADVIFFCSGSKLCFIYICNSDVINLF